MMMIERAPRTRILRAPRTRHEPSDAVVPIDQALLDPQLLGAALGDPEPWSRWLSILRGAFALPMSRKDRETFAEVAGDRAPPTRRVDELWAVVGRRGGKTRTAAAIASYIGAMVKHELAPGEVGHVLLLAPSKAQGNVAFSYIRGFLESSPILRQQLEGEQTQSEIKLRNNIVISVHASSFRTVRGRTLVAVIGDETAFWRDETSAMPDLEVYRAVLPALVAANGMFIGISTGYRKIGLLYTKHRDHFAKDDDSILVIQAGTSVLNPTMDERKIARAMAADPEASESEWLGGFRNDISSFLSDEVIDAAVNTARPLELPPQKNIQYRAFCDASGGRKDSFTLAIGHREGERIILDVVRGTTQQSFDPQDVVNQYAALIREYRCHKVRGDNYSAEWNVAAWRSAQITYERSEIAKSGLYLEGMPLWMRGLISIPEHPTLLRELRLLERRTSRMGKDVVDHGRVGTDDYANAVAGCIHMLANKSNYPRYDVELNNVMRREDERTSSAVDMLASIQARMTRW
jgi:hypothetical protein